MGAGLQIEITGVAGSGKTTTAAIIARTLRDAGFQVFLSDDQMPLAPVRERDLEESWRSRRGWNQRVEIRTREG